MSTISDPHNALFKLAFGDPVAAAVLLRRNLGPEAAAVLNWATITREPGLLIRDDLSHRESDLRFSVARVDAIDDDDRVVFSIEHQSTPDREMARRSLDYNLRTHEDLRRRNPHGRQLRVYSLLFAQVLGGWTGPRNFDESLERGLPGMVAGEPKLELWIDDISFATNRELQRLPLEPFPKLALWVLRDARDAATLLRNLRHWRKVFVSLRDRQPDKLESILSYLANVLEKPNYRHFVRELNMLMPPPEKPTMTYREATLEEGERLGLQKALKRLIRRRFGGASEDQIAALGHASAERLEWFIARLSTADTAEAVDEAFAEWTAAGEPLLPLVEELDEEEKELLRQHYAELEGQRPRMLQSVVELATNKFGRVTEAERARLELATAKQLERMLMKILLAESVAALIDDTTW